MLAHSMNIAGLERKLPICRVTDDLYIGAFVIFGDCELTTAAAKALLEKAPEYDYIITAESKGIPLAQEMARLNGDAKWMLARKGVKLYIDGLLLLVFHSGIGQDPDRPIIEHGFFQRRSNEFFYIIPVDVLLLALVGRPFAFAGVIIIQRSVLTPAGDSDHRLVTVAAEELAGEVIDSIVLPAPLR